MSPTTPAEVPDDVTDVLLWRLAVRVAADHQPDPHRFGRCANLRCVHDTYPCPPLRDAQRAHGAATRARRFPPGRARVPTAAAHRFAGWFRPTPPAPTVTRPAPIPLPRQQPMAALRPAV